MSKVCTAQEAVALIQPGQTVASVGVIGWLTPDALLGALAQRFRDTGSPRDLTFFFPVSVGDALGIKGMDHVAIEGLMKRVVSGNYLNALDPATGKRPEMMRLIRENRVEAYCWPIGATMHWLREVARRGPGYLTPIGIGSYIDPRQQGGKYTERAREDLVRLHSIDGHEYLHYPTWPLNVGFIRATSADEHGNLSFEDEPITSSALAVALAVKASGGTVIAQVRKLVPRRSRSVHEVRVPGELVDHVVVAPEPMMTTGIRYDDRYLGRQIFDGRTTERLPQGADKVIARRAAAEVRPGVVTIFGFGASSDVPTVMMEDGAFADDGLLRYNFTTEHGPFGGVVMSGWQFSANMYPEALIDGPSQFDFIDGGNCEAAALAFAQFDRAGNVNVSRFGAANPGPGGFIDIAYNARELVFTGTFTTAGLGVVVGDGRLTIQREGKVRKFVERVDEITYPLLRNVAERGQKAKIVTERAVFAVEPDGLVLTEVAPGIDAKTQVIDLMDCPPHRVLDPLPRMADRLFRD
ncbi:CoA-transferase [Azospirillum sp. BE72]|uniref:CoA-transferase n=1 Tax=Azospirillum sp. BE72 TaxID=2817776 RepID=UPI0028579A57|nr:malonate decarboxylase subunit alpha [Azospirillum sp. BE72]MDR6775392.1 propionate CoA-transferase [Azospirillum sp. BE72]